MSRTYKDRPWLIRYKECYGKEFDFNAKPRGQYNGINDNWIREVYTDRGAERSGIRDYTKKLKNSYNSSYEINDDLLEPQEISIYVH